MPGVPSSRGCDACRKQKKKCDQAQPSCSRCARLQLACVGAGAQRFKFMQDHRTRKYAPPHNGTLTQRSSCSPIETQLLRSPSNNATRLTGAFVSKIIWTSDLSYHLCWAYGGFLEDIPRRLGTNEALDAAVSALVSAHSSFSSRWAVGSGHIPPVDSLAKYTHAVSTIRRLLDDPIKACAVETLCAVMLLLICQAFLGVHSGSRSCHGEGAAKILKARRYYDPQDKFECKLLLSLRGPVLFEALVNDRIEFSREGWTTLVQNDLDGSSPEGRMMCCLAKAPDIMRRGRLALLEPLIDMQTLLVEARSHYATLKTILNEVRDRYLTVQEDFTAADLAIKTKIEIYTHAHYQRSYGLALCMCLIFNCILTALDPIDITLYADSSQLCAEVVRLADEAAVYRPLAAAYIVICLIAAWCSTKDKVMRDFLEEIYVDFSADFNEPNRKSWKEDLEDMARRINLLSL